MADFYDLLGTPTSNTGALASGATYMLSALNHFSNLDAYMGFGTNDNYESTSTGATWIEIVFSEKVIINSFDFIEMIGTDSFGSFEFQGSNDGSSWDVLYSYTMQLITSSQTIVLNNTTGYRYYRFFDTTDTGNGSSWRRIKGIYLYGCLASEFGDTYTVIFHSNNTTSSTSIQNIQVDKTVELKTVPFTYSGYDFIGWATIPEGAVVYEDKAEVFNLAAKDETLDLYAVWRRAIEVVAHWIKIQGRWVKI